MVSTSLERLPSRNKRRRVAATACGDDAAACPVYIHDILSGELLKEVATYLTPPSRILFAIAITRPNNTISPYEAIMARSRRSTKNQRSSSSIAGTDWATLDFGLIEKDLAAKLTDDDIRDVLLHIDAANKVKRLFLTNCTNISGIGLRPLSGSRSIEQIDLSLVTKHQSPNLSPVPPISCDIVLPILDSILSNETMCRLKYLNFPSEWRERACTAPFGTETVFQAFLARYNEMLQNGNGPISCLKCDANHSRIDLVNSFFSRTFGTQLNICHECLNHFCHDCPVGDDNARHHFCSACEREYCENCVTTSRCGGTDCGYRFCIGSCMTYSCASPNCDEKLCNECKKYCCDKCYKTWCDECCSLTCLDCEWCTKRYCHECSENDQMNGVLRCDEYDCVNVACSSCLLEKLQEGELDCIKCIRKATPLIQQLKDENKELKDENEALCQRIQNLEESKQSLEMVMYNRMGISSRDIG